jgi:glutaredoxin
MEKVIIYATENCKHCQNVKEELAKQNIKFESRLTKDYGKEWLDIINLTGMPTTPAIHYKDSYFLAGRDFADPQQLIDTLKSFEKITFNESKQALERVKTLNYNINMAFRNLTQLVLSSIKKVDEKIDKL